MMRKKEDKVKEFCTPDGITWKFQPPGVSHFVGIHERPVRSAKGALYRTLKMENTAHRHPKEDVL